VLDPVRTLASLEHGSWIYRYYFILKWRRSLRLKCRAWPDRYDESELLRHRSLTAMTEHLVRRYTEFPDLDSYLNGYAITGDRLAALAVPAWVLSALDDPIIPAADLVRLAPSPQLRVVTTRRGGHCGFLDHLAGPSWADRWLSERLAGAAS
jgi:predicted alpha/beta-fold hydrolase